MLSVEIGIPFAPTVGNPVGIVRDSPAIGDERRRDGVMGDVACGQRFTPGEVIAVLVRLANRIGLRQ